MLKMKFIFSAFILCICIMSRSFSAEYSKIFDDANPVASIQIQEEYVFPKCPSSPFVSFYYDPQRVSVEKERYTFKPIQFEDIVKSPDAKVVKVPMGECQWTESGTETILYTDHIYDCVGIVFVSATRVGLTHISMTKEDHMKLQGLVSKIENPEAYKVSIISHYYSKNLEYVTSILTGRFSILQADISDNVMEYYADDWHKWYYSQEKNMQAQNVASREVYVNAKGALSKAMA